MQRGIQINLHVHFNQRLSPLNYQGFMGAIGML
jgi:hypothetical protein